MYERACTTGCRVIRKESDNVLQLVGKKLGDLKDLRRGVDFLRAHRGGTGSGGRAVSAASAAAAAAAAALGRKMVTHPGVATEAGLNLAAREATNEARLS